MLAVVQRVTRARVESEGEELGAIGPGMLVLVCVLREDGPREAQALAQRIARMRFFPDDEGRMNRAALDVGAAALVVSQFTLAFDSVGERAGGRRPSFERAAPPDQARPLVDAFVAALRAEGITTATGRFGAAMQVELVNDGPVTLIVATPPPPAA